MLRNYLKVAMRYLLHYKVYTGINILGLAVGITCCILIMLFVRSEVSYDTFHSKADRLYRVSQHEVYEGQDFVNTVTPLSMASVMQQSYPEIEGTCRVFAFNPLVKADQNTFTEDVRMVDSTFFRLFDFSLTEGNRNNPLADPNAVIITEETAAKYFGKSNATGKQLEIQLGSDKVLFTVSGIVKKAPEESSIKYGMLISFANAKYMFGPGAFRSWFNVQAETYVLLKKDANTAQLENKFPAMIKAQLGEDYEEGGFSLKLQPVTAIHLDTSLPAGIEPISSPKYSYILASIGLLLLLLACINFITLSVGRSASRALEVGVRKALGAERQQLIRQFWGEAFLLTLLSVLIGLGLSALLLGPFNQLAGKELVLHADSTFLLFCFILIGVIAMIAGIYPAIVLSGYKPVEVLKGKLNMKTGNGWLRQGLVVVQFATAIAMIGSMFIIGKQMKYLRNKDLGYDREQVVIVPTNKPRAEGLQMARLYSNELLKHAEVADVTVSIFSFAEPAWAELGYTDEKRVYKSFQFNAVDANFIKAMQIDMASGRNFSADNPADITSSAIVNEAFVQEFGLSDPVGKKLPGRFDQQIIGVTKDFNFQSLHTKVRPLMMVIQPDSIMRRSENISFVASPQPRISVRLKAGNTAAGIDILRNAWKVVAPNQDFEYRFLDESINAQYKAEQRTSSIVSIASILAVFIACMGLFGLATLAVVKRTKEIGIRKVLGASVTNITVLLSKDFIKLVAIAAVIAFPLSWWFMSDWLKDFAYRTDISWWVFAVSSIAAMLIALLTVSFQAVKAAIANPVESLRSE